MESESVNINEIIPNLSWYQNKESVMIDINNLNPEKYNISVEDKIFSYNTTIDNNNYKTA